MSEVLIRELHAVARSLGGDQLDPAEMTRRFWSISLRLRASLPPLRLPVRVGSTTPRVGFLAFESADVSKLMAALENEQALSAVDICVYTLGNIDQTAPGLGRVRCVVLKDMSELQAARMVAAADLDVLVDACLGIRVAPVVIALKPARVIIAPLLDPLCEGAASSMQGHEPGQGDLHSLLGIARAALAASPFDRQGEQNAVENPAVLNLEVERGVKLHRSGQLDAAASAYGAVLARYPRHPIAAYMLGQLNHQQGQIEESIIRLQQAVESAPEFRDAQYTLAQRLADCGRWDEAVSAYRRVVALTPDFAAGWSGLGLASAHGDTPQRTEAISHIEKAVQLEPENSQWRFNLGSALQHSGSLASARSAYQQVLIRDPGHETSLFNLAAVAQEQGDFSTAIRACQDLLQRRPDFSAAYTALGTSLQLTGRIEEWAANFRLFRVNCAESLPMAVYGLEASMAAGDANGHLQWRDRILAGAFPAVDDAEFILAWEQLLFLLLHVDLDRGTLRECYERYDRVAARFYGSPLRRPECRRPGRTRIGYLSADLREHVMGRMIHEWVSRHDKERFDIRLYSLSSKRDALTEKFIALGVPLIDLSTLRHADAAARIRDDDIDLLIDCCGHTRGGQPGILALRPARSSATHIATPGPLGLRAVDFKLTDALAEAADNQRYILERLLPIKGGIYPWRRYSTPDDIGREGARIDPARFVCGAFVTLMKLSPRCLDVWRRILGAVPEAILAFSPQQDGWKPAYIRWLDAHGIDSRRIVFLPCPNDVDGQLARYRSVDVVLDPLPCGNVNGTMEALSMNVPVVTLKGLRHGERLGHTLLTRFGVTATIADDDAAYVETVVRIARDKAWAVDLRARIAHQLVDSPVWDAPAQVRNVEKAYASIVSGAVLAGAGDA